MRRFRFAALSAAMFVAVAGAFLLSASAVQARCFGSQGSNSATAASWTAGGQAGYNWQQGSFVYGFETDLSGTGLKSSMSGGLTNLSCFTDTAGTNSNVDWYGTVRGRAGWTAGKALFYGTGGLAYGSVDLNSSFNTAGVSLNSQTSSVRTGWVAGVGIEYMWQPNLVLTLGYQYVDLGTANVASSTFAATQIIGQTASARAAFQVVTAGFVWRFSPTGTAPHGSASTPWEGAYFGGQAGGAWGNMTNANYSSPSVAISDVRLKRGITLVGRLDDGLGLYQYRYLWSDTVYVGVMAQEVALIHPEAIVRGVLDDYLRVDYGRLGLKLMTLPEWDARNKGERL
jgi:outer membrane immunogenic protein